MHRELNLYIFKINIYALTTFKTVSLTIAYFSGGDNLFKI